MSDISDDLKELCAIIRSEHSDSLSMCGGDGNGCPAYRPHFDTRERRWRKCGQCTMEITQPMIDLVDKIEPALDAGVLIIE